MKYVKWTQVLAYLTIPVKDNLTALRLVYDYLRLLNFKHQYTQKVCILDIKCHKADIPTDLIRLESLAYNNTKETGFTIDPVNVGASSLLYPIYEQRIAGVFPMLPLIFLSRPEYINNYTYLRYKHNAFANKHCSSDCPNLSCDCKDTFEYLPDTNQYLFHSIESGKVCISYLSMALDSDEDLLIPDDTQLMELLAAYIKYKYWEVEKQVCDAKDYNRYSTEYTIAQQELSIKKKSYVGTKIAETIDSEKIAHYARGRYNKLLRSKL